jgi:hypothetical protein
VPLSADKQNTRLRPAIPDFLEESKTLADRLLAAEAVANRREENIASSIKQIEFLNAELMAASAERFKMVAAVQGEQRRQRSALNQKKSTLEYRLQEKEALAATQRRKSSSSRAFATN